MTGSEYSELMKESPEKAHKMLFDEYYRYVRTVAFNCLRGFSDEDVEECISDIFAEIFFSFREMEPSGDLKAFVGTVARRRSVDHYRSQARRAGRTVLFSDEDVPEPVSEEDLAAGSESRELRQALMECIKSLGEPDSLIIIRKFYYNMNSRQIAKQLSMKPSAVRMRCRRAADKLKEALVEKAFKEGAL